MHYDDEIRELLGPKSRLVRTVGPQDFLKLNIFKGFQPNAVSIAEYLQLFDFRLEEVIWKAAPSYVVLLNFVAESGRRYFVTSNGEWMRLYRDEVVSDIDHFIGEQQASNWQRVAAALFKAEYGD
jgi:hypothetical protein